MRHYEIVFLVHPDQSEQVPDMAERYRGIVESSGGSVHRYEDWGMRRLAYPIEHVHKAHYVLFNVECGEEALQELNQNFQYNDAVLRRLIIRCEEAVTEPSPIAVAKAKHDEENKSPAAGSGSTPARRKTEDGSTGSPSGSSRGVSSDEKREVPENKPEGNDESQ